MGQIPTELNLKQVSEVSGYHYAYVRQLACYGKLASVKRGKCRYVKVDDLLAHVAENQPFRLAHLRLQLAMLEDTAA
jgi:hypothetical protein